MTFLTNEEINKIFITTPLEENYNFLEDDLIKLAHAFEEYLSLKIARLERAECIKFVKSLNTEVAKKLSEKRGSM